MAPVKWMNTSSSDASAPTCALSAAGVSMAASTPRCMTATMSHKLIRLFHVVRGHQDGRAEFAAQLADPFPHGAFCGGIEPDGWLVHKQNAGPMQHGLRDFQAANHAAGILPHEFAADVREVHEFQGLRDPARPLRPRHAVKFRGNQQIFVSGQIAVRGKHLRDVADLLSHRLGMLHQIEAGDFRRAFRDGQQRRQHFDQRALPRAVRAEQAERRAGRDGKRQMIDGDKRAVSPREGKNLNDIRAGSGFHGP